MSDGREWSSSRKWAMGILGALIVSSITGVTTWFLKPNELPCLKQLPRSFHNLSGDEYVLLLKSGEATAFPMDARLSGSMDDYLTVAKLQDRGLMLIRHGVDEGVPEQLQGYEFVAGPTSVGREIILALQNCVFETQSS